MAVFECAGSPSRRLRPAALRPEYPTRGTHGTQEGPPAPRQPIAPCSRLKRRRRPPPLPHRPAGYRARPAGPKQYISCCRRRPPSTCKGGRAGRTMVARRRRGRMAAAAGAGWMWAQGAPSRPFSTLVLWRTNCPRPCRPCWAPFGRQRCSNKSNHTTNRYLVCPTCPWVAPGSSLRTHARSV